MKQIEIRIPAMGEGITEASIIKFLKQPGDTVTEDETLAEIATDKVDTEIVSPVTGKIENILFKEGDIVRVGETIITVLVDVKDEKAKLTDSKFIPESIAFKVEPEAKTLIDEKISIKKDNILYLNMTESNKFLSPLVRNIAEKEGITIQEIDKITGTGLGNRITKEDIIAYANRRNKFHPTYEEANTANQTIHSTQTEEILEMDRMRKLISEHMLESKRISAHVTSFIEVDLTGIVTWRNKIKEAFLKKTGEKLTYTPIFIEAVAQAIKEFPMINVSVDGSKIILKKQINIGMATALPNGNLIVPVIKNVAELNLLGITKKVNDLAERARTNKLKPDEIQGGTFTITNVGTFNNLTGTPIINQPEVAILAVGAIKKKPAVIETEQGDTIGIRNLMIMSMSYDHRVVDGALGGMFINKVAEILESFDWQREI
jgi:2-oxoglutarate dehydrogenase E2 component (dihydrolipoamide succinyltransferase)